MPTYPTNYYGPGLGTNYNNNVTRRIGVRDRVAWGTSQRFGGQYIEDKNAPTPYQGTIIDAVAACQQLVNELNLISPVLPDMGTPVILSSVGVATNRLLGPVGAAVSYIGGQANANVPGGVTTSVAEGLLIDGVAIATGMRILYFGLQTSQLNGVYQVGFGKTTTTGTGGLNYWFLQRAPDLFYNYQFVKPKAYVVNAGNNLRGSVLSLQSDFFETGPTFTVAMGTSVASASLSTASLNGNPINFVQTYYSPLGTSGINATTLGVPGAGNTSCIESKHWRIRLLGTSFGAKVHVHEKSRTKTCLPNLQDERKLHSIRVELPNRCGCSNWRSKYSIQHWRIYTQQLAATKQVSVKLQQRILKNHCYDKKEGESPLFYLFYFEFAYINWRQHKLTELFTRCSFYPTIFSA